MTAKAPDKTPPKIAPPCDVPGCGHTAVLRTDGTEKDVQGLGRPAIAGLNVCGCDADVGFPVGDEGDERSRA